MPRLASAAVAAALCLALGACSDAADTPEQDAVAQPSDAPSSDSTPPPSEPTDLFIARVTKSAPAKADGCLNSVRTGWQPDSAAKTQRLCGVQSNEETWFFGRPGHGVRRHGDTSVGICARDRRLVGRHRDP